MTQKDINRMYTEQVARYLAQGYQINPGSMGGTQGELAHTDLTNGEEIIRVLLNDESVYEGEYGDFFTITVGRNTDRVRGNWNDTIWNEHLDIIFQIRAVKITNNHFVTVEEWKHISEKRLARWKARDDRSTARRELGTGYKSVALGWLRRQPRMKGCRLEDIGRMYRVGAACYEIEAKGKTYRLAARKHN